MQHLRSLFKGYTPVQPKKNSEPFSMSKVEVELCPDDVRKSFESFTDITTYTFHGHVLRFFHQGQDCDTKVQHIARFLHKFHKPVVADILLSPVKKYYPQDKVFGFPHVNTGYCTSNRDKIVVFREEEWFKVFIHEYIHYCQWETILDGPQEELVTLFHRSFHVYEAYCEVCARILNCCYISAITRIPVGCLYEIERQYSLQHMVNVLHHMEMDYSDVFNPSMEFKETTNVFAYVVITAILMYARYIPPHKKGLQLVSSEKFIHTIVNTCKRKSFFHEMNSRVPSVTTTMTKLNVDEFISHH